MKLNLHKNRKMHTLRKLLLLAITTVIFASCYTSYSNHDRPHKRLHNHHEHGPRRK